MSNTNENAQTSDSEHNSIQSPPTPSAASLAGPLMMLPALFIMNKIDFNAGQNMLYLRITFACAQITCFSLITYIYFAVKKKADPQKMTYQPKSQLSWNQEGATPLPVTCTHEEYDIKQVKAAVQQFVISFILVSGIHYYWGSAPPLFFNVLWHLSRF